MNEIDLRSNDGRTLHAYDAGSGAGDTRLAVFWHHGTPNIGAPPEPLFRDAAWLGLRWVSYDRPGYGGSTPLPGRDVASAAVVAPAVAAGPGGLIDDDLAYAAPWGFDPAAITAPVLLLHGGRDRVVPSSHGQWLAASCPSAELWLRPDDGHISVLNSSPAALDWLATRGRELRNG